MVTVPWSLMSDASICRPVSLNSDPGHRERVGIVARERELLLLSGV